MVKNLPGDAGDTREAGLIPADLIPGFRISPGVGNGHPLKYSCLGNPTNRGDWWAAVHGVEKCRT